MSNGYAYWREMQMMKEIIEDDDSWKVKKPITTQDKFNDLMKEMAKQKKEYEKEHGISMAEERRKMMSKTYKGF